MQHPGVCVKCEAEVGSSSRFCSSCGASLAGRQKESEFGAFGFHSRWFILVLILASVASFVNPYLLSVVLFAYIAFVVIHNKLSVRALIGQIPSGYNWWPIVLLAIGGLLYSLGAIAVIIYPIFQLDSEFVNEVLAEELFPESPLNLFIATVILAPLLEETIFRGLLFSRLTKKWGMAWGIIVSSLAFGFLHMDPIGAFVFGVITCVLYVRTKTLLIPMALHALHNLIVWVITVADESGEMGASIDSEFITQLAYVGLIGMILGAPIVFTLLGRWWPSRGTPIPYEANKTSQQPYKPQ